MAQLFSPIRNWQGRVRLIGIVALSTLRLLALLLFVGSLFEVVAAEERGSISGIVKRNGQSIPEHRIMLIRFGSGDEVQRTPGQTDTQGRFVFDNLETGNAFEYVVGIRYAGQLYRSESVRLLAGQQRTGIVVEVEASEAQTTAEPETQPALQIANHLIVIVLREDHLEVREIVRLLNNGSIPYHGAIVSGGGYSFHIPLPYGYYNLTDIQGLPPEQVRLHASGLYYTAPLDPGEHRAVYTYSLPLVQKVTTVLVERTLPTAVLDVLVGDAHLVASSDLQFGDRVSIDPHTFWHFQGTDLGARSRSWLQVTQRTEPATLLRVTTYSLIIGIALLGVGGPLYGAWCGRKSQAQPAAIVAEHLQGLKATRVRLLQTIAWLDEQHAAGSIADSAYHERRQAYKAQLLALAEQLQYMQGAEESRHP